MYWPDKDSITWVDPKNINGGKQYEAADGVTAEDFNNIVFNLLYIKNELVDGIEARLRSLLGV